MGYTPQPIDTTGIQLTPALLDLTEQLARNAHDVWARKRLAEGWTLGESRDDSSKKNPYLVPYEELPDSEKEYDRSAAMETLRAVIALGYRIEKR